MRINLTKKDLINQIYMQLGFSKLVSENLINDFFSTVISAIPWQALRKKIQKNKTKLRRTLPSLSKKSR